MINDEKHKQLTELLWEIGVSVWALRPDAWDLLTDIEECLSILCGISESTASKRLAKKANLIRRREMQEQIKRRADEQRGICVCGGKLTVLDRENDTVRFQCGECHIVYKQKVRR